MRRAGGSPVWPWVQSRHAVQWLTALGMAVALGMLALGGAILLDSRNEAWHQAEQASNNLVLALTRDIARNIALYDLSIQGTAAALARPDIDRISPATRQMVLFDRAITAEYLGSLLVLNANGDIVASSTALEPPKFNFSDRDYFRVHRQQANIGLFVSRAYRSRLRGGDPSIAISRRISRPDGTFGGIVVGTLRLAYFHDLFSKLDLGSTGTVTLVRSDGRVIMRFPFRESDIDTDLGDSPIFRQFAQIDAGSLIDTGSLDGVDRLYTFRHVSNLPLILSVGAGAEDIYAAWWPKALGIGSVLSLLCGGTLVLSTLFRQEILRRMEAESSLRDAAKQLAVNAATDGLTGLANRRTFEERLTREWNRSIRAQTPIALLMLDADLFKGYNDHYGHVEGDRVLRSIAACIARNAMRPGDTDARYGGEEFAVLLPETDLQGASVVAERIRSAVEELDIPYNGSPTGHVTISIGVAVAHPALGDAQTALVELADAALYNAKYAGRNQVSTADWDKVLSDWKLTAQPPPLAG